MTICKRLIAVFMCACAAPGSVGLDAFAQTAELEPPEYGLWEGEWVMAGSSLEDNVYSILRTRDADSTGFSYEMECRDIPYGPNTVWSGQNRAVFQNPLAATDATTDTRFTLSVNPDDRQDRLLEMTPLACTHTDAPSNTFEFRRIVSPENP